MHLFEDKNSPYTFIYISREYYNGKCLDENVFGIGQTKDPIKRLKEHNTKSSKTSTYVKFELVYKVKNKPDYYFHNILKQKGFPNLPNKKEIFRSSNTNILTLEKIQAIIEQQEYAGPWTINNDKIQSAFSLSITQKTKQENQLKEKLNSYTQETTQAFNTNELIAFLNNKSVLYDQLSYSHKNNPDIQQWAYNNNKIKYAQLDSNQKLNKNTIIRAIINKEINNTDFLSYNTSDQNKLYILKELSEHKIAPTLRLNEFTKKNYQEIKQLIKNNYKLTITEELRIYIEQQTKQKYITQFSNPIDLPEIYYLLRNNIIIFEQLHPTYKYNDAIQKFAFKNNHLLYKDLSDNLKLNNQIILQAIEKAQFHLDYIIEINKNNPNKITELLNIVTAFNLQLELNDYTKKNIELIIRAFKNNILEKRHLSQELFSYIYKNYKFELYTPRIIETAKTHIPKIKYSSNNSFFEYIKIIIPVFLYLFYSQ